MQVKRISHATLRTPDLERQIDYYCAMLGMHVAAREANRAFLATREGVLVVALESGDDARCERVAFQVAPGSDLDALRRELTESGIAAEIQSDTGPGLHRRLTFKDPKGTEIDIYADIDLLAQDPSSKDLSLLKLGHLAFNVVDFEGTTDFYVRHLGFRVSDYRGDVFVFLRCGPDHHTVNFFRSHDSTVKMHHVAFELRDSAEILRACDFLGRHDYRMIWGPGRHLIGGNIFTYHLNPDGQKIELYTELDQVKNEEFGSFEPRAWHPDRPQKPKVWPMNTVSNIWGPGSPPGFGE